MLVLEGCFMIGINTVMGISQEVYHRDVRNFKLYEGLISD